MVVKNVWEIKNYFAAKLDTKPQITRGRLPSTRMGMPFRV